MSKTKNDIKCVLMMFLLSSMVAPIFAESAYKNGDYYLAPGVGYYHFSDKRDLQNATIVDMTVGYVVSERMSLEALYGQAATEPSPNQNQEESRFYAYWLDGVYHFQPNQETQFYPYLLGGIGITSDDNNSASSGNTSLVGFNGGAGVEYFFHPGMSFFADIRDVYTLSGGINDVMLNAGIKFVFDRPSDKASTASSPVEPIETSGTTGFYELQDQSNNEK